MCVICTYHYMGLNKLLELGTSSLSTMFHLLIFLKVSVITRFSSTLNILTWSTSYFILMILSLSYLLMFWKNLYFTSQLRIFYERFGTSELLLRHCSHSPLKSFIYLTDDVSWKKYLHALECLLANRVQPWLIQNQRWMPDIALRKRIHLSIVALSMPFST